MGGYPYLNSCTGHEFCLEQYHIIECGYAIKCNLNVPENLYFHVSTRNHRVTTPFKAYIKHTNDVLAAMTSNDIKAVKKVVQNPSCEKSSSTEVLNFVEEFFELRKSIYKKPDVYTGLQTNESSFNHLFVWLIMGFAADNANEFNFKFIPREYIFMVSEETNKVDVCIIHYAIKLCLLETSRQLFLRDNTRYGFNHIKGNFGALIIFNHIYKKYCWASKETAGRLKTLFVYARHDTIYLWLLELCSSKLYCSNQVLRCVAPKAMNATNDILALGIFVDSTSRDAARTIQAMKNEHNQYEAKKVLSGGDNRVPLNQLVNLDIKKPIEGSEFGILIPTKKEEAKCSVSLKNPN
ncbi:MAG: hypothetical protein EXX96DRAFT_623149 [Benjaminiella poitrasii]|nr:MAG: hypothetical protein EXX96DRAFT_623149 [Benjaminiella poitrasii]